MLNENAIQHAKEIVVRLLDHNGIKATTKDVNKALEELYEKIQKLSE